MKVLPIGILGNYNRVNHAPNTKEQNNYKNYTDLNILNKSYNQISFGAISKSSLELTSLIPLEDRLASVLEEYAQGDLILVGRKIHKAKLRMLDNLDNLDNAVKRVLFIPDEEIPGYLGFFKSKDGNDQVINLNDFELTLMDGETYKVESLGANDSFFIFPGDSIGLLDRFYIDIKEAAKTDLSKFQKGFCEVKDFTADTTEALAKLNRRTISQLSKEAKVAQSRVTFKDVGGQDELIQELKRSIIYPLKYPEMFTNMEINRGFIFYGPPGTGKTHIARALANEADVNFVSLNGTELESKWVGESEENWRNLFAEAKQKQPTIIFIDEFDAVGKARGGKDVHGDKVVNQILTLMTDLENNGDSVFVIAATNNVKALDSAMVRSGRFSKKLEAKMPNLEGTGKIFEIHTKNKSLDRNLDKGKIIQRLFNIKSSGADIKYIVNEAHSAGFERAGIYEKMENGTLLSRDVSSFRITQEDFDKAIAKFLENRKSSGGNPIGFSG